MTGSSVAESTADSKPVTLLRRRLRVVGDPRHCIHQFGLYDLSRSWLNAAGAEAWAVTLREVPLSSQGALARASAELVDLHMRGAC